MNYYGVILPKQAAGVDIEPVRTSQVALMYHSGEIKQVVLAPVHTATHRFTRPNQLTVGTVSSQSLSL